MNNIDATVSPGALDFPELKHEFSFPKEFTNAGCLRRYN
jgi:hypothetical protein